MSSKTCLSRQDSEKFTFAKFEGSLAGVANVTVILPTGWKFRYTSEGPEINEFRLTAAGSNESFPVPNTTFVVVSASGTLELHSESSFNFLFREAEEFEEGYQLSLDPGYLWGG